MNVRRLNFSDHVWAAELMANSEPWLTLCRGRGDALKLLRNPRKQCFLIRSDGERAGLLVLDYYG